MYVTMLPTLWPEGGRQVASSIITFWFTWF